MGILEKFLPAKPATADAIRAEIDKAQDEITSTRTELTAALGGIALMSDAEHQKADERAATLRRAVARLEAKITGLESELPAVIAAETAAANAARDQALRARADAARKAVRNDAAKLLAKYDDLAEQLASVLMQISSIDTEVAAVNQELARNPVAVRLHSVDHTHRKQPDRVTEAVVETRLCWVTTDPATGEETARPADTDANGNFVPPFTMYDSTTGRQTPAPGRLEKREIATTPERRRPGAYLHALSDVRLPPGSIASGKWHWPRQS